MNSVNDANTATPARATDQADGNKLSAMTPKTSYVVTPADEEEEAAAEENYDFPHAIAYDEEVPVYWDKSSEQYYYYGYPIAWDEEQQGYYYYSHEDGDYMYIDEETAELINTNQVYTYNDETGEYEFEQGDEPAGEAEAGEEGGAGEEEQLAAADEEIAQVEETDATATPETDPVDDSPATPMDMPGGGLYGMAAEAETGGVCEMSPSMVAMLKHVQDMNAAAGNSEKFPNSIDSFSASYHNVGNKGHKLLYDICSENPDVLDEYKQRPNGTFVIGRCKRTVDGLIKGSLELKSLAATEVSSVASVLQNLSLPQLVYIRYQSQNSPWTKSPQSAAKAFAMKCDDCIGEKLVQFMLSRSAFNAAKQSEVEQRNFKLFKKMGSMTAKHCGNWTVYCLGVLSELTMAKEKIMGADGCKASWWWQTAGSGSATTMIKGDCDENDVRGIFVRVQKDPQTGMLDLRAQFDCPKSETNAIYRLIAGRGETYIRWDVAEVSLGPS